MVARSLSREAREIRNGKYRFLSLSSRPFLPTFSSKALSFFLSSLAKAIEKMEESPLMWPPKGHYPTIADTNCVFAPLPWTGGSYCDLLGNLTFNVHDLGHGNARRGSLVASGGRPLPGGDGLRGHAVDLGLAVRRQWQQRRRRGGPQRAPARRSVYSVAKDIPCSNKYLIQMHVLPTYPLTRCVFLPSPGPPCSAPEKIAHGLTDWDGKSRTARYACFQGFHLIGPPRVECRYGRW